MLSRPLLSLVRQGHAHSLQKDVKVAAGGGQWCHGGSLCSACGWQLPAPHVG